MIDELGKVMRCCEQEEPSVAFAICTFLRLSPTSMNLLVDQVPLTGSI